MDLLHMLAKLGNKLYAATLGARFDTADLGKKPKYSLKRPQDTSMAWRDTPRDISTGLWGQPP